MSFGDAHACCCIACSCTLKPGFGAQLLTICAFNYRFTSTERIKKDLTLGQAGSIKVALTTEEGSKAKRAHQAFLVLKEKSTGLEAPFPLTVKDSGKATLKIVRIYRTEDIELEQKADCDDLFAQSQKDLPIRHASSESPLEASIIVGSFGTSEAAITPVFDIKLQRESASAVPTCEKPMRYGKLAEIHHIFKADPQSPPKIFSLVFATAVLGTIPALFIAVSVAGKNTS